MIDITKQGLSKARMKFNPLAFKAANEFHIKNLYSMEPEIKTYNGRLVVAIDGSDISIPTTKENIETFGNASVKHADKLSVKESAMASASCAFDVLNKMILDSAFREYKIDERKCAMEHILKINEIIKNKRVIYVCDRGYPSLEFIITLIETSTEFVIRLPKTVFKREQEGMNTNDEYVDVEITNDRIRAYKSTELEVKLLKYKKLNLRFTKTQLEDDTEYIISNLPKDEFTDADISRLYKLRWGIETMYNCLKNKLFLCNFSGIRPIILMQDFYSTIYLHNLISDMEQQQLDDETPYCEKTFKVNDNKAIGILKERLIELLMAKSSKTRSRIFEDIVRKIQKNLVKINPDRHFVRGNTNKGKIKAKNTYKPTF